MRIGIIGGGQLGMMMAKAAIELGHEIVSLDPQKQCSITKYSNQHLVYNYNDKIGINKLIESTDVITYEFENIDTEVIQALNVNLPQKLKTLKMSQNRLIEKNFAKSMGIKTPIYKKLESESDLFYPSIIKSTSGGYDGKGQLLLKDSSYFDKKSLNMNKEYIIEELIDFDYEISIISTRDSFGNIVYYPTPRNVHKDGILFTSTVTNDIPRIIISKAKDYTRQILESLNYVGTLAVEYFVSNMEVIFNEFAPRPHNSGHYSIEGCNVSQFKNHILAITNKEVIEPVLLHHSIMINILGQNMDYYIRAKSLNNIHIHCYHKQEIRANRKMGHITITRNSMEACLKLKKIIIGEHE
ncbi:5-(carboxyamino)imidazole ribonucleotide synthase [Mycoplasmatota bacterium WC30]